MARTLFRDGSIVTASSIKKKDVMVDDGVIRFNVSDADQTVDASEKLLFPGLIDCHVHFREPGHEHKATMKTEAESAKHGGVFTVCEMPNTNPPTVTVAALADKVRRAEAINGIDMRFFFGITQEIHLQALTDLWTGNSEELLRLRKCCCGVKMYLEHSTGNQKIDPSLLDAAFSRCGSLGIPIVAHCEDAELIAATGARIQREDIASHSARRPPEAEALAVHHAIELARKHEAQLHVAHASTKEAMDLVREAKKDDLHVTCEVAPHHLFLTVDDYEAHGTFVKMNPPLRTSDHQEALWAGIEDGTVDCIATDHAPHTIDEKKTDDPLSAPSGVPGVETMLPLLLTVAAGKWPGEQLQPSPYRLSLSKIIRLCFDAPNEIFSLGRKGIEEGSSTPIVIVDPKKERTIGAAALHSKCGWTPYEGWKALGTAAFTPQ